MIPNELKKERVSSVVIVTGSEFDAEDNIINNFDFLFCFIRLTFPGHGWDEITIKVVINWAGCWLIQLHSINSKLYSFKIFILKTIIKNIYKKSN